MAKTYKATDADRADAIASLLKIVKPESTIFCVLRTRARSGMSRTISFYAIVDNRPMWLDGHIATALGYQRVKDSIRVGGVGFDAGHHVVSHLARTLFGSEEKLTREWI
jgi:hypothetical protein